MSEKRPELRCAWKSQTFRDAGSSYLAIYNAVRSAPGLIHGRLHGARADEHCAIGWTFRRMPSLVLPNVLIDEVATINDSMPTMTLRQRRAGVLRWLRWKLKTLGMAGFKAADQP